MGTTACCTSGGEGAGQTTQAQVMSTEKAPKAEEAPPPLRRRTMLLGRRIGFKTEDGTMKYVNFEFSPLGMTFHKTTPVTVKSILPYTSADALGIQKNWIVAEVCGEDTTKYDMESTRNLLEKMACDLPISRNPKWMC